MEANSPLIDLSEEIASTSQNDLQDNGPKVPYGFEEPIAKPSVSAAKPTFATSETVGGIPEMSNFPTASFTFEKPRKSAPQNDLVQDLFSTPEAGKVISLEGKVNEVKRALEEENAKMVVFDDDRRTMDSADIFPNRKHLHCRR